MDKVFNIFFILPHMRKIGEQEYQKIKKTILKKMYSSKTFRKGHLLIETLQSGIPPHLIGFVRFVLDDLIKQGIVVYYGKTGHGLAYQLNIQKLNEIEDIIFNLKREKGDKNVRRR